VEPSRTLVTDQSLSRRLERTEAQAGAQFVEARARMAPESGAAWFDISGTYVLYDGPRSPATQSFGLGLFAPPTEADLNTIETFFRDRTAPAFHEVSPLADKELLTLLPARGYRPVEFTSVMYGRIGDLCVQGANANDISVRVVGPGEHRLWAEVATEGWRELVDFPDLMIDLMLAGAGREGAPCFLAELAGRPVAAGALHIHDGVALLAGASTIPEARKRGAQRALLQARLRHAREAGCDLAMIGAEPGSASQRNAERQGFRIAYTRIKWGLQGS
jgi:GNAT superfamily N-acetyltransferase